MRRNSYTADGNWLSSLVTDEVLEQSVKVAKYYHPEVFASQEVGERSVTFINREKFSITVRTWNGSRTIQNEFLFTCDNQGKISLDELKFN